MVFGLFESKSEKLTKKYIRIFNELIACGRRVLNNPDSNWWKKYWYEMQKFLLEIGEDVRKEMGKEYYANLISMAHQMYDKSIYKLSKDEEEILDKLLIDYKSKIISTDSNKF
jgi:hypothetical protein